CPSEFVNDATEVFAHDAHDILLEELLGRGARVEGVTGQHVRQIVETEPEAVNTDGVHHRFPGGESSGGRSCGRRHELPPYRDADDAPTGAVPSEPQLPPDRGGPVRAEAARAAVAVRPGRAQVGSGHLPAQRARTEMGGPP